MFCPAVIPHCPPKFAQIAYNYNKKALQHNTRASDTRLIIFVGTDVRLLVPPSLAYGPFPELPAR